MAENHVEVSETVKPVSAKTYRKLSSRLKDMGNGLFFFFFQPAR